MRYIKYNLQFKNFPKDEVDLTDPQNPVLVSERIFKVENIAQKDYSESMDIIAVVKNKDSIFDTWYKDLSDADKLLVEVLTEEQFYNFADKYIQICSDVDSSKSQLQLIKEHLSNTKKIVLSTDAIDSVQPYDNIPDIAGNDSCLLSAVIMSGASIAMVSGIAVWKTDRGSLSALSTSVGSGKCVNRLYGVVETITANINVSIQNNDDIDSGNIEIQFR